MRSRVKTPNHPRHDPEQHQHRQRQQHVAGEAEEAAADLGSEQLRAPRPHALRLDQPHLERAAPPVGVSRDHARPQPPPRPHRGPAAHHGDGEPGAGQGPLPGPLHRQVKLPAAAPARV